MESVSLLHSRLGYELLQNSIAKGWVHIRDIDISVPEI